MHKMNAEKTTLIALLAALAAVGRAVFAAVPSVQPSSFIIIAAGIALGPQAGFLTGALTALLSGLILGIGPWTPWQLLAWGLMGLLSGLLQKPLAAWKWLKIPYGVAWGFLFGWIMNLWMLISMGIREMGAILAVYGASFIFDLAHGAGNGLLMAFGGSPFIKMLRRVAVKYGL